jgi:cation/acetate symporter
VLFLVALAFGVASSVNFPVLILSMYWKGLTTRGALWGGIAGLASSVGLVILSPTVWVKILGNKASHLPVRPSGHRFDDARLSSSPGCCRSPTRAPVRQGEAEAYEEQYIRAQTGLGASGATTTRDLISSAGEISGEQRP